MNALPRLELSEAAIGNASPIEARDERVSPEGLTALDFTRLAANGFGDAQNSYAHSMAEYRNHLYVGTSRHLLALLKLFPPPEAATLDPWPVKVPDSVEQLDLSAQIWRYRYDSAQWEHLHTSPVINGRNGKPVSRDLGYRGMAVFQGQSDPSPALYVSALSSSGRGTGARILRSSDGVQFEPVSQPGLGNPNVSTFRSLVAFDGHLFAAPAGEGTTWNTTRAPIILRSADPLQDDWQLACTPGFGDPTNAGIFEMEIFNDHLYAATFNHALGYQIWKTPATGTQPCRWTKVIERGAYRGNLSEMAMSLCVFDNALYVGSGLQNGGYDRTYRIGPAAGEVIRIFPDDSWELVIGLQRDTPRGLKEPIGRMGPGFDNFFNGYIWRMAVHRGWLYVGTFDWSVFLPYAQRQRMLVWMQKHVYEFGVENIVKQQGGFDLWKTRDGAHWSPVTLTGFGNPYNYGVRTMVSSPLGLFVGTANPFGPEVPARLAGGWTYVPNPNGGAEVWLGVEA
jgi:hypothetical protein